MANEETSGRGRPERVNKWPNPSWLDVDDTIYVAADRIKQPGGPRVATCLDS